MAIGAVFRAVRHRLGWRQRDLALKAGVSQQMVSLIEQGYLDEVTLRALRTVGAALGIRLRIEPAWRGIELRRLLDADHAALSALVKRLLERDGWRVEVEVTYSRYGERGSIDLIAIHPSTPILLVVEVKTVVTDLQDALRRLDAKARLAVSIAVERGWISGSVPRPVVPMFAVRDDTTSRRRLADHDALLGRYALRGRAAWAWLRRPDFGALPSGILIFKKAPPTNGAGVRRAGRQRVRARSARSSVELGRQGPPAEPDRT